MRIVVQHTPKCGGTSLRQALQAALEPGGIYLDYDDRILEPDSLYCVDPDRYWEEAVRLKPLQRVIFGHFPIRKYAHIEGAVRVALIRHPISRLISHFLFAIAPKDLPPSFWRRYALANNLDVVSFARLPAMRTYYRKYYFPEVGSGDFDLIISTERMENGIQRLSDIAGVKIQIGHINATKLFDPNADAEAARIRSDTTAMDRLNELLADEIAHYREIMSWPSAA